MGSIRGVLALPAKESDGKDVRVTQIRHNERILDDLPSACGMDYNVTLRLGLPTSPHPCFPFFSFRNHPPRVFGQWVEVQRLAVAVGWIFYVPMVLPFVLSVSPYQLPPPTGSRLL